MLISPCISVADSWVHCNDSRMQLCTFEDVTHSQAYILFYTKVPLVTSHEDQDDLAQPLAALFEEQADEEIIFNFKNSTIPKFVNLKRQLSEPGASGPLLKRRRSMMW